MSTTTNMVATAGIVTVGTWAKDKDIEARTIFGAAVVALILAFVHGANEDFANKFSLLILVSAAFMYLPAVWKKSGLNK